MGSGAFLEVLVAPMDTGIYEMSCNSSTAKFKIPVNCSAWHLELGTLEHLTHLLLPSCLSLAAVHTGGGNPSPTHTWLISLFHSSEYEYTCHRDPQCQSLVDLCSAPGKVY